MKELCERLLGRSLQPADGTSTARLAAAEQRLGVSLPPVLRTLYTHAGNVGCLMESFQRFAAPEQCEIYDGRLVFLEENQGICFWGVEIAGDRSTVWQRANEDTPWYSEDVELEEFLRIVLYYQCAQGGYGHVAAVGLEQPELLELLAVRWEKVVEHSGLHIYWQPDVLIWWLGQANDIVDCVFFCARTRQSYERHVDEYFLAEL